MFAVVKDCKRNPEKLSKIKRGESHAIPSFGLCQIEQSFCFAEPAKVKPLSEESG